MTEHLLEINKIPRRIRRERHPSEVSLPDAEAAGAPDDRTPTVSRFERAGGYIVWKALVAPDDGSYARSELGQVSMHPQRTTR